MLLATLIGCAQNGDIKLAEVRTDIERNVPLGSTPQQVAQFLNTRGYTSDGPASGQIYPTILDPDVFEMPAIIRDTRRIFPVEYSISMKFTFGPDHKLRAIKVEEVGTGP